MMEYKEDTMTKSEKKKMIMRDKILNTPTMCLKGDMVIDGMKPKKKVMLLVDAELLNELKGQNLWEKAEGEKPVDKQEYILHSVKKYEEK